MNRLSVITIARCLSSLSGHVKLELKLELYFHSDIFWRRKSFDSSTKMNVSRQFYDCFAS